MLEAGNNAFAPRLPVQDLALVIAHPAGGGKKRTKEEAAMGGQLTFPAPEAEGSRQVSSSTCRDPHQLLSTPWLPPHPLTSLTAQARMK